MESPSYVRRDKRFRWLGRVSEEELLGLPASGLHRTNGHSRARPAPMPQVTDVTQPTARGRWPGREIVAMVAVGGAVWVVMTVAHGRLPEYEKVGVVPTGSRSDTAFVVPSDRSELRSLPREAPTPPRSDSTTPTAGGGHSHGSRFDDGGSGGSDGSGGS